MAITYGEEAFREIKKQRRKSQTNREGIVMLAIDKVNLKQSTASRDNRKKTVTRNSNCT